MTERCREGVWGCVWPPMERMVRVWAGGSSMVAVNGV